jgi:hypothetical protein
MHGSKAIAGLITGLILFSCTPPLEDGEWGQVRYFGEISGEAPMRLLPPVTDREGNIYVAYGNRVRSDTAVWVGRRSGGWKNACKVHRGEFGVHGFIGRSSDDAWLWTGDALVHIWGNSGTCHELLDQDPVTGTLLRWQGVAPWVRDSPSRKTTLGIVRAAAEEQVYVALLDLDRELMVNVQPLQPAGLSDLRVIGTGADPDNDELLFVIAYDFEGNVIHEALIYNSDGEQLRRITLDLDTSPAAYAIVGFFQPTGGGAWAGVREDGGLILISKETGYDVMPDFDAIGLLKTESELFVTGLVGDNVVAAKVANNSALNGVQNWDTPTRAASGLNGSISVLDERNSPLTRTRWDEPENAIGSLPLLTAHPLDRYTLDSTGWLVAGPSYPGPAEEITAVGFAPLGWSAP